jgi:Mn-dependent DtxR family transcriptional regulator
MPNHASPPGQNPPPALTKRQQQYLDCIVATLETEHHWPTVAELADNFAVVEHAAFLHVKALEKKGYLTRNARGRLMLAGFWVAVIPNESPTP